MFTLSIPTSQRPKVRVEFPRKLQFLFRPKRYKVAYGGRGAGRSWGFARALLSKGYKEKLRILCARELQVSIADSVHHLLVSQISLLHLEDFYEITQTSIVGLNGTEFIFAGVRNNVTKIKSMEDIDICWVEEAEKVSNDSWEILIPTIRKNGSEIWVTFNPDQYTDPTYQRFVVKPYPADMMTAVKMNFEDNRWFPQELERERVYMMSVDPDAYSWVYLGNTREVSDAQVLKGKYVIEPFVPAANWDGPYQGADWGFSQDPTTLIRCWIHDLTLYIEHEAYGIGLEIDKTPERFDTIPRARDYVTRGDNARPETISYLQRNGYSKLVACTKWTGSVEDGIARLRAFKKIVIHPRCRHTADEARLWAYKQDKLTGDVLPDLIDKHNHCWDAIRYALEPIIRRALMGLLDYYSQQAAEQKAAREQEKQK